MWNKRSFGEPPMAAAQFFQLNYPQLNSIILNSNLECGGISKDAELLILKVFTKLGEILAHWKMPIW